MTTVRFRLLAFASAAQALGATELDYELHAPSDRVPTVADLERDLVAKHPQVEKLWQRLAVSVEGKIAASTEALSDGVEVALLPPVSGG